jgi:UDP-glucose 4-epimerase
MTDRKLRVVILGGLGFIGKNFATKLAETQKYEINILDKRETPAPSELLENEDVYVSKPRETKSLDENDDIYYFYYNEAMDINPPDIVFHFGEYARVEKSLDSIEEFFQVVNDNVLGTWRVFSSFMASSPEAILFYAGSSTRFSWDHAYQQSPYSFTKYMNAEAINCISKWFHYKMNTVYFYNVFGEGEELGEYGTVVGNFKKQFLDDKPIMVYGGDQTRRFTYIEDVCNALVDLTLNSFSKKPKGQEFHFFNPNIKETSITDLAKMFYNDNDMIKTCPMRAGCRMKSVDQSVAKNLNTFGEYNMSVKNYIEKVKKWKTNIT